MCGICGVNSADEVLVGSMLAALHHRGPDEKGIYSDGQATLGACRLSIIDIERGHQPISNEDETVWAIFNGEIYNFKTLSQELTQRGHSFRSRCDSEVLVHGYEEYGLKLVKHLNGMFAFCIYDKEHKMLFLARDRFGEKPLFYRFDQESRFLFASEIKGILCDKSIERIVNVPVAIDYIVNGELPEHTKDTFFVGINRLPPGYMMSVIGNTVSVTKYYRLPSPVIGRSCPSIERVRAIVRGLLEDSVRMRLVSEVRIGTCLSGGVDSSVIAGLVNATISREPNAVIGERQRCFSYVSKDPMIDESKYITNVAEMLRLASYSCSPNGKQLWDDLPRLVYQQDEPFEGMSVYAQWAVMQLAKTKVTVLLDGQGSDEIFGGYQTYLLSYLRELLWQGRFGTASLEILCSWKNLAHLAAQFVRSKKERKEIQGLLKPEYLRALASRPQVRQIVFGRMNDRLSFDIVRTLPRVLRYEDRNSMSFSLETRLPYLDHRLVEYALSIPADLKIRRGSTKYILRQACDDVIPEAVRLRRKKIGFETPELDWLRTNRRSILELFQELGQNEFDVGLLSKRFDVLCDRRASTSSVVGFWRIINYLLWKKAFEARLPD